MIIYTYDNNNNLVIFIQSVIICAIQLAIIQSVIIQYIII